MLIILEGCDATGKTTLANLLARTMNGTVIHCTADTPNTIEFFSEIAYASRTQTIIADRFCYGQFVYQDEDSRPITSTWKRNILREESDMEDTSWDALWYLESRLLEYDVKLIYTYADPRTIADRMVYRGENPNKIGQILNGYEELWKHTLIKPIPFKT